MRHGILFLFLLTLSTLLSAGEPFKFGTAVTPDGQTL